MARTPSTSLPSRVAGNAGQHLLLGGQQHPLARAWRRTASAARRRARSRCPRPGSRRAPAPRRRGPGSCAAAAARRRRRRRPARWTGRPAPSPRAAPRRPGPRNGRRWPARRRPATIAVARCSAASRWSDCCRASVTSRTVPRTRTGSPEASRTTRPAGDHPRAPCRPPGRPAVSDVYWPPCSRAARKASLRELAVVGVDVIDHELLDRGHLDGAVDAEDRRAALVPVRPTRCAGRAPRSRSSSPRARSPAGRPTCRSPTARRRAPARRRRSPRAARAAPPRRRTRAAARRRRPPGRRRRARTPPRGARRGRPGPGRR